MANAKKTTTPKKTTTRKAPAKTAAAKKTTVVKTASASRKVAPKKAVAKKASTKKQPAMKSFKLSRDQQDFTEFRITRQTVYWVIIVSLIIFVQLWILKLQVDVASLLEAQRASIGF